MGRRRRSSGFDIVDAIRLVAALVILGVLAGGTNFLSGAKTAAEAFANLAALLIVAMVGIGLLCGVVLLIVILVRRAKTNPPPIEEAPARRHVVIPPREAPDDDSRFMPPTYRPAAQPAPPPPVAPRFTWELLQKLEWRAFERLVTGYFHACGLNAERRRAGADGGVDIVIHKPGMAEPFAYVQCKAWNAYTVGVKPVRELFGVMAAEGVRQGYFVATRDFPDEARDFARDKPLKLVTGGDLLDKLNNLEESKRSALYDRIVTDDYTTPTCPACDIKMVRRESKNGPFWGCMRFPRCRQTLRIARSAEA